MTAHLPPITVMARHYRQLMRTGECLAAQVHPLASLLLQEMQRATPCAPNMFFDSVVILDTIAAHRLSREDTSQKCMLTHTDGLLWPWAALSAQMPVGLSHLRLRIGDRRP